MTNYNPDSLRALFKRSTGKRGEWNLSMLEVALSLHADAWEAIEADNATLAQIYLRCADQLHQAQADNAALREQADVDRSFIEQYQREVAALRKDIEAEALAHQGTIESWMAESKAMHDEYAALNKRLEEAETGRKTDAELLFQAGCVFALSENPVPAVRMFERAKKLGHPDAEEQLVALAGEDGDV